MDARDLGTSNKTTRLDFFTAQAETYGISRRNFFGGKQLRLLEGADRATRCACIRGARGDPERARNVDHTAIRRAPSPVRPGGSGTAEVHGCPRGVAPLRHHTVSRDSPEEQRLHRFTFLGMRGPPASPLFASWPWPHHNSMLVGTS
jgi:hypothetical protein